MKGYVKKSMGGTVIKSCYNCRWGVAVEGTHKDNGEPFIKCVSEAGIILVSEGGRVRAIQSRTKAEGWIFDPYLRGNAGECPGFEWERGLVPTDPEAAAKLEERS